MAKATTQVNTPNAASVATEMPDFLKNQGGLGNEGVNAEDLVIPRLGIIQSTSPELDADDLSKYIPGCKLGQIFNTLTRELFDNIAVVDCYFRKEFVVFVKRTAGGGFRGAYPTQGEAVGAVEASDKPQDMEIVETGNHFCLVVNPDNMSVIGEVVVPHDQHQAQDQPHLEQHDPDAWWRSFRWHLAPHHQEGKERQGHLLQLRRGPRPVGQPRDLRQGQGNLRGRGVWCQGCGPHRACC